MTFLATFIKRFFFSYQKLNVYYSKFAQIIILTFTNVPKSIITHLEWLNFYVEVKYNNNVYRKYL